MGRIDQLKQTLGCSANQVNCSCVLVDYSCPQGTGDWAETHFPAVRVLRLSRRTEFNASIARNFGAGVSDAPWLCFVDADVAISPSFADVVVPKLVAGGFYRIPSTDGGAGGTFVCARADFERVGGYDETYRGWGEEDNDLYDALEFAGLQPRSLPAGLVEHLGHDDARRIRHYGDLTLGHAINRVYRIAKWDTARLRREALSGSMRQPLYDKVVEVVTDWYRSGRPGDLAVHLPPGIVPGNGSLARILTYRLTASDRG
jgi:N-terminal domain of galactosyltransferase